MANLILFIVMFLLWCSLNEVFISIFSNISNLKIDLIFLFENFLENLPLTFFFEILIVYFYFLCYRSENIFTNKNIIILILLILLVGKKDISSIYLVEEYSYKKSFENIFASIHPVISHYSIACVLILVLQFFSCKHNAQLLNWGVSSVALLLGSIWAFFELGWGGFWFFDNIENYFLGIWLLLTIGFHTYRNIKIPYLLFMFLFCMIYIYGRFLIPESIHTFIIIKLVKPWSLFFLDRSISEIIATTTILFTITLFIFNMRLLICNVNTIFSNSHSLFSFEKENNEWLLLKIVLTLQISNLILNINNVMVNKMVVVAMISLILLSKKNKLHGLTSLIIIIMVLAYNDLNLTFINKNLTNNIILISLKKTTFYMNTVNINGNFYLNYTLISPSHEILTSTSFFLIKHNIHILLNSKLNIHNMFMLIYLPIYFYLVKKK